MTLKTWSLMLKAQVRSFFVSSFTLLPSLGKGQSVTTSPTTISDNNRVRKTPPSTTSSETTVIIKRPKTDTAGSRGRTRISDFDDLTKSLTEETISIFQAQIVAVQPWPSTAETWESISQGWIEVCASRKVRIELDDEIFKVVSNPLVFLFFSFNYLMYFRFLTVPLKLGAMQRRSLNHMWCQLIL